MKRVYLCVGLLFLAFAAFWGFEASKLRYYSTLGPGPGFFPVWLSLVFGVLTLLWLFQVSRSSLGPMPAGFVPALQGRLRVMAVLAALTVFAFTLDLLGFRLAMLAMLAFLLAGLGRQHPLVTAVIALLGSFGLYYLFTGLGIGLPNASLDWLTALNL